MVFHPPAWVPKLPFDPPDSMPIGQFIRDEKYGRHPIRKSRHPFTCGITGKSFTAAESLARSDLIAKALGKRLGWSVSNGTPWDKVVGVFSFNTIDYLPLLHAVHRLNGIVSPMNAACSTSELEHQLKWSGVAALVTCMPLLGTALRAAKAVCIPDDHIFILDLPGFTRDGPYRTVDELVEDGKGAPNLEPLVFTKGQGARQPAFLCYSSGTSGLPKAVMVSHRNVIANILQFTTYESVSRKKYGVDTQTIIGLLPFSHIYALVIVAHISVYRGDQVVVLPKFEFTQYLTVIERFKINCLMVVPPIVVRMLSGKDELKKHDLSSVRFLYTGAAPTGAETVAEVLKLFPHWHFGQGYGMTETSPVICTTSEHDQLHGSSGSLIPGGRARIIDADGKEVTKYDTRGELVYQGPNVVLGYLHNEKASAETFVWDKDGRWIRTGDEVIVTKAPSGYEHIVIVDRIKELIKVKGHQVAPAELEAHLLAHSAVDDCAVIAVPHDQNGEAPKAFVVKNPALKDKTDDEIAGLIHQHMKDHKAHYKWLEGGIEFVDAVPKSPSGKILRRLLKDKEREARRKTAGKL